MGVENGRIGGGRNGGSGKWTDWVEGQMGGGGGKWTVKVEIKNGGDGGGMEWCEVEGLGNMCNTLCIVYCVL